MLRIYFSISAFLVFFIGNISFAACAQKSINTDTYSVEGSKWAGSESSAIVCGCNTGDEIIVGGCYPDMLQNAGPIRLDTNVPVFRQNRWEWVCGASEDSQSSRGKFLLVVRLFCKKKTPLSLTSK